MVARRVGGVWIDSDGNPAQIVSSPTGGPVGISRGELTDRSGTITLGGTAQPAAVANPDRLYLLIQNPTTESEPFWLSLDATAVAASPSIEVIPGATFFWEGSFVPTGEISVIAANTGTKFTIKEG